MPKPHLAVIVGSNRRDSINRKLALALAKLGADKFDANFVRIDHLPMFNQDLEGSLPPEVVRYKNELAQSRRYPDRHARTRSIHSGGAQERHRLGCAALRQELLAGKPAFITGTSPGAIGSAIAQQHLRSVMVSFGMILLGGEAYVTFKPNLIDEHGNIADESTQKFLQGFVDRFATLVERLAPAAKRSAAA